MTITRLWQAGAEFDSSELEFTSLSTTSLEASSTKANTGTYSFRLQNNYRAVKVLDAATTQLRIGFFLNHAGGGSGDEPHLLRCTGGGDRIFEITWDVDASTLYLKDDSSTLDSALSASFATEDTWMHLGIDAKIAGSGGWISVYLDGVEVLSYTGDTTGAGSNIDTITWGSFSATNTWNPYLYLDDMFIDDTAGESSVAVVPDYRFDFVSPNGNGNSDDWTGSDADSTDNYLHMDEIPPDGDTSYVETDVGGNQDDYAMGNITLPTGYVINAVISMAVAKKLDAAGTLDLKLGTRAERSATPYAVSSGAKTLGTDYAIYWDRRTTHPDSGAWDETTVNTLQVGVIAD